MSLAGPASKRQTRDQKRNESRGGVFGGNAVEVAATTAEEEKSGWLTQLYQSDGLSNTHAVDLSSRLLFQEFRAKYLDSSPSHNLPPIRFTVLETGKDVISLVRIPPHKGCLEPMSWRQGKKLGQGGFGAVYMAMNQEGELIAVKKIDLKHTNPEVVFVHVCMCFLSVYVCLFLLVSACVCLFLCMHVCKYVHIFMYMMYIHKCIKYTCMYIYSTCMSM